MLILQNVICLSLCPAVFVQIIIKHPLQLKFLSIQCFYRSFNVIFFMVYFHFKMILGIGISVNAATQFDTSLKKAHKCQLCLKFHSNVTTSLFICALTVCCLDSGPSQKLSLNNVFKFHFINSDSICR